MTDAKDNAAAGGGGACGWVVEVACAGGEHVAIGVGVETNGPRWLEGTSEVNPASSPWHV